MTGHRTAAGGPERPLNASFDDEPERYDDLRAAGHMARRRAEYFRRVVARVPGQVVELGCGTGTLLRRLATVHPDRSFLGVEPLPNYVEFARERAAAAGLRNVRFESAPGEELDQVVPSGSAGLVISVDSLHHVVDLDRVVAAVHAATAVDGRWYAMEPNRVHPYVWAYHVLTTGERTFAARDFLRRARQQGWTLVDRRRMFIYPSGVRSVPAWAAGLERQLETNRLLSGALVHDLVRT
ncbi:methyltransferase domain-containing protein [Modestobacter sp. I12A-02662]|uniref:class I SAM-dependent methyltransferase n=1 Tax=Modestobacter sp. I12A-02662 TaxID=1730496 RepID=UPI0034DDF578